MDTITAPSNQTSPDFNQIPANAISTAGIKNNKGKFVVLVLYLLFVFSAPLIYSVPFLTNTLTGFVQTLVPKNADESFRQYIALLKEGNVEQIYSLLPQQVQQNASTSSLQSLVAFYANTTDQMEIIGAKINTVSSSGGSEKIYDVTYEIQNNDPVDKYILAEIISRDTGGGPKITGFHSKAETQSIKDQWKFDFATQGMYLILSLLLPLFIAYTALRYIRKAQKPKWILFLVILFLSLIISITGNSAGFFVGASGFMSKGSSLWGPWIFALPIPLGAIYYYFVRARLEKTS